MCGRFTITSNKELIIKRFRADLDGPFEPRYNAAPNDRLPVILNSNPQKIELVEWGLKPAWIKKLRKGDGLINIRAETLRDKATFRADLERRRCLVIADGFYEWQKAGKKKIPFRATLAGGELFAFAGLWEENMDELGRPTKTFAIITVPPNALLGSIHDRMPAILEKNAEAAWLDPGLQAEEMLPILRPLAAKEMIAYQVSADVNSPQNDHIDLIRKVSGT
jgi:putative SOS response-associated peptidase YedK